MILILLLLGFCAGAYLLLTGLVNGSIAAVINGIILCGVTTLAAWYVEEKSNWKR